MNKFHTDMYLHFLQQLSTNAANYSGEALNHVLNRSVCFSESAWGYSCSYTGATLAAAQSLLSGESDVAISLLGGQTHARRDCASGFSYVNDVILSILQLLRVPAPEPEPERRVLFINVDGWHCSGVEEAFYTTDRVMCISLHRYAEGAFPGSGGSYDAGERAGKGHNINLPVKDGLTDEGLATVLDPVVAAAAERFCPHCVVACVGAGVVSGDRLGCLNVSVDGHTAVVRLLAGLKLPLLFLGGLGYTQLNAARAWCNATATLCGQTLAPTIPASDDGLLASYSPGMSLAVKAATMADMNDAEDLETLRDAALETIAATPQRNKPAPPLQPKPAAASEQPPPVADGNGAAAAAGDSAPPADTAPSGTLDGTGEGGGGGAAAAGEGGAASMDVSDGAALANGGGPTATAEAPPGPPASGVPPLAEGGGADEPCGMDVEPQAPPVGDGDEESRAAAAE
jgi:histone deacetylase 1/2